MHGDAQPEPPPVDTATSANPYSTGGGGVRLEHRYGALFLARLLVGGSLPGLADRSVARVAFQQSPASAVDDLIVIADPPDASPQIRLAVACRRNPKIIRSDSKSKDLFRSLVEADIDAAGSSEFDIRLGIASSGWSSATRQLAELADLARGQNDASSYFALVNEPGRFNGPLRSRLSHVRDLVTNALKDVGESPALGTEERSWTLLSRLFILPFRLERPDDQDWADLANVLKPWSLEATLTSATALRNELDVVAGEFDQIAAVVDANMLRRRVHAFINPRVHRSSSGWARVLVLDRQARESVPRTLSGSGTRGPLVLERPNLRAELAKAMWQGTNDLLVRGDSGVGKSAAVLDAVDASATDADCQALVLNLRDLPASPLELVAGLGQPLEDILAGLTAPTRLLVVDAADAAAEGRREVLGYILRSAREEAVKVVGIATAEAASGVAELMKVGGVPVDEYEVPLLTDEDIDVVARHFPDLERLARDLRGRDLLRRPIVIELLARAGDPGVPLSDAEALQHIWAQLVRNGERQDAGLPDARDQVMLQLAAHALSDGDIDSLLTRLDFSAVAGLRHSGLLRSAGSLPWERVPEFAHDLLRAYAVARHLLSARAPAQALSDVGAPRWALPAARLACQVLLSADDSPMDASTHGLAGLQSQFDELADAGYGERWRDVPTEAMLGTARPGPVLDAAWPTLLENDAAGLARVFRLLNLRHKRQGILDAMAAEPVVAKLVSTGIPPILRKEVDELITDWLQSHLIRRTPEGQPTRLGLSQMIVDGCAAAQEELERKEEARLAALAARTPEEIAADEARRKKFASFADIGARPRRRTRQQRWRAYQWIEKSSIGHLALLGADLGPKGSEILHRLAADEPESLAPAVETLLAGDSLASYDVDLLLELVEAYYLDEDEDDDDGFGYAGIHDRGVRDHVFQGWASVLGSPLRGPFLALFRAAYVRGVASLNRLLNHAARHRVRSLSGVERSLGMADERYALKLSIAGTPRLCLGDEQVWFWYRGTGTGPQPCMSALQALEIVTDEFIRAGAPVEKLVSLLLEGAENLAMPGFVVGLLIRHLESAGKALDPFLVEPEVWELEFARTVQERASRLAANVPTIEGADRRAWNLRDASMVLTLRAQGDRVEQLRHLGEQLVAAAVERVGDDGSSGAREYVASVRGWAASLDKTAYEVKEHEGQLVVAQAPNPEIESILADSNNELYRANQGVGLLVRHAHPRDDGGRAPEMSVEDLAADLAIARDLLSHPPDTGLGQSPEGPVAVAASAVELYFEQRTDVKDDDLLWSARVLSDVAMSIQQNPRDAFDDSYLGQAVDRSAARAFPYLLLPEAREVRRQLGLETPDGLGQLVALTAVVACMSSNEARLAFARALDVFWSASCSADLHDNCHHELGLEIVEMSLRDSVFGPWDNSTQERQIVLLEPPILQSLGKADGDAIIIDRLAAALRALSAAAISDACCANVAATALNDVLRAHERAMLSHEHGYNHSASDALVAVRAALWQTVGGRDEPLLKHIRSYLGDSRALAEALIALNIAAEERPNVAREARRIWPCVMDLVLDAVEADGALVTRRYWGESVLAALVPAGAQTFGCLTLERPDEPQGWRDLLGWSSQVDRWVRLAVGNRTGINALVAAVSELDVRDQVDSGLRWIERVVGQGGEGCAWTTLPEWLRARRADLTDPEQEARWQRVVDVVVVSGDHRVADLAD